jgi:type II secretory pathway pseudopilin PulG
MNFQNQPANLRTKIKNLKGFSLVELIVYCAILVLVLFLLASSIISINDSFREIKVSKNLRVSAYLFLESFAREVRGAEDINDAGSDFATSTGKISLISNAGASTTEMYFSSGKVKLKKDGIVLGDLIASDTTVESLYFDKITTSNSKAIKVKLRVRSSLGVASSTETFYLTSVLRNSY